MLHNLTYVDNMKECVAPESKRVLANLPNKGMVPNVQILILASARIVCNIVYVQVQDRIHRELCCKN
jgi:hypothetical protein